MPYRTYLIEVGGELFRLLHGDGSEENILPTDHARFYMAQVLTLSLTLVLTLTPTRNRTRTRTLTLTRTRTRTRTRRC